MPRGHFLIYGLASLCLVLLPIRVVPVSAEEDLDQPTIFLREDIVQWYGTRNGKQHEIYSRREISLCRVIRSGQTIESDERAVVVIDGRPSNPPLLHAKGTHDVERGEQLFKVGKTAFVFEMPRLGYEQFLLPTPNDPREMDLPARGVLQIPARESYTPQFRGYWTYCWRTGNSGYELSGPVFFLSKEADIVIAGHYERTLSEDLSFIRTGGHILLHTRVKAAAHHPSAAGAVIAERAAGYDELVGDYEFRMVRANSAEAAQITLPGALVELLRRWQEEYEE